MNQTERVTIAAYATQELKLVQPSLWKRVHHLQAGDTVLMTMHSPKWYSTDVIVEGFGETWKISRPSFWSSKTEITKGHDQLPTATFVPEGWKGGGIFHLPNGERIEYRFGMWKNDNELYSMQKVRLVSFRRESIWRTGIIATFHHASTLLEQHPWIVMAVYQKMLERRQHAQGAG